MKSLEEDQKRRATRSLRDGIDRILVDLLSLYRDVLLIQLGVVASGKQGELINLTIERQLVAASCEATTPQTLRTMDAIATARTRIAGNVTPALALEAMLVSAVRSAA